MGEPWEMSPDADLCPTCELPPKGGICPRCGRQIPPPLPRLWPLGYLALLGALLLPLRVAMLRSGATASPVLATLLALLAAAALCGSLCVYYFFYAMRNGKDKRLLLRVVFCNFAVVLGSVVALVAASLMGW